MCFYLGVKVSVWWGPTSSPDHSCWSSRGPRADVAETHYCHLTAGLNVIAAAVGCDHIELIAWGPQGLCGILENPISMRWTACSSETPWRGDARCSDWGHIDSLYQDEEKADFNDHSSLLLPSQLFKLRASAPLMPFHVALWPCQRVLKMTGWPQGLERTGLSYCGCRAPGKPETLCGFSTARNYSAYSYNPDEGTRGEKL